jgi:glycerol-1-phosphate dehydrogenase [NAD(P)+]
MAGDLQAMRRLARTLVLSGLGMCLSGGSYPASQGEHLISHYIEMMGGGGSSESFHGEQIGVTTLSMARLQERVLETLPVVRPTVVDSADLVAHFGLDTGAACAREMAAKALSPAAAAALNDRLAGSWPAIRERVAAVRRPAAELRRVLEAAGAPTRPTELGWPTSFYRTAVMRARQIRSRYSFLDLAGDAGLLEGFAGQEG